MKNNDERKLSQESAISMIRNMNDREWIEENIKMAQSEGSALLKKLRAKQAEADKYARAFKEIDAYYNALKIRLDHLNNR